MHDIDLWVSAHGKPTAGFNINRRHAYALGKAKVDRAILSALCHTFAGRPVGLGTLAVAVGEAPETVEDVYEPFLLQCGLLERTPRGRVATPAAFVHLGLHGPAAPGEAPNLF